MTEMRLSLRTRPPPPSTLYPLLPSCHVITAVYRSSSRYRSALPASDGDCVEWRRLVTAQRTRHHHALDTLVRYQSHRFTVSIYFELYRRKVAKKILLLLAMVDVYKIDLKPSSTGVFGQLFCKQVFFWGGGIIFLILCFMSM